jgi:hypothetical protein
MFNKKTIFQFIFVYFVVFQVAALYMRTKKDNISEILIAKFTLFEIGLIIACIITFFGIYKFIKNKKIEPNKTVIILILLYTFYHYFLLIPILYFQTNVPNKFILYFGLHRSVFLLVLFLYWFALPSFIKIKSPYRWLEISSIVLLGLLFTVYLSGQIGLTSTGEARIASGMTSMLFAFVLIANLSLFSGNKNNLIFILVALIGLVFANHRSGYLALALIILISLLNSDRIKNKSRVMLQMAIVAVVVLIPLSQVDMIRESFTGRVTTSLDYKDPNALDRYIYYGLAWEYFLENPIAGSMDNGRFYVDNSYAEISPPHSFIFQLLSTQGIIGFGLIMSFIFFALKTAYKNKTDQVSFQMFLLIIFYLAFTVINDNFLNHNNIFMLCFPIGVILYRESILKQTSKINSVLKYQLLKNISSNKSKEEELVFDNSLKNA